MKNKTRSFISITELFLQIDKILSDEPDEDRCQVALMALAKDLKSITDPAKVSSFESHWLEIRYFIKKYSDEKIYEDYQKEIENYIMKVLDPENVEQY